MVTFGKGNEEWFGVRGSNGLNWVYEPAPNRLVLTLALQPVAKVGSRMETTATSGAQTRRTGLLLRTFA